jgi:hypothetical protein
MPGDDESKVSNLVLEAAERLNALCASKGWRYCFIGGLSVQVWSEPRVTDDVDLTLVTGFGTEERYIDELLAVDWLQPRREDAREFALSRRVLLLRSDTGVAIDIAMGAFPFESSATSRARNSDFGSGIELKICTAEDLIVFKTFAARPQDWRDVEMTIVRQGDEKLDWEYVREQLRPLVELKEQPELMDQLEALRDKLRRAPKLSDFV